MEEFLSHKHLLFDTCVISDIFESDEPFVEFLEELGRMHCVVCINDIIYIEFLRRAQDNKQKKGIKAFLDQDLIFNLPMEPDIIKYMKDIYPLYSHCSSIKKKQVSLADAVNVMYLKKIKDLHLITYDIKDYPMELLDRKKVGAFDIGKDVLAWAIYKFSESKLLKLTEQFENS